MSELTWGQQIGGYRIDGQIGRGGMATVYRATQLSTNRLIALKVLPQVMAHDPDLVQRFRREAETIVSLNHPNIVPVYDAGEANGVPFIAMMYVQGGTLRDRITGPVPENRAIAYVLAIASALDYAHKRGVIHRDIKPHNILFGENDWVLVADFGIARAVEGDNRITTTGAILGTPEYLSPEQGEGLHDLDGRSDMYSLGVLFYELLTGNPPFSGRTPYSVIFKHLYEAPPPLPSAVVSKHLNIIVQKMLAKKPEDRYASMSHLIAVLQAVAGVRPVSQPSMSLPAVSSVVPPPPPRQGTPGVANPVVTPESEDAPTVRNPPTLVDGPSEPAPGPLEIEDPFQNRPLLAVFALVGLVTVTIMIGALALALLR